MSNIKFTQDSMSCIVDDRFYQSQNNSPDLQIHEFSINNILDNDSMKITKLGSQAHEKILKTSENNTIPPSFHFINGQSSESIQRDEQKFETKTKSIQKQRLKSQKYGAVLQKKKQNSKNYRQRKKQYMQKLQQQNNHYKRKCAQLQQQVRLLQAQIGQLKYDHDNHQKYGYQKQWKRDVSFLKDLITEQQISNSQLAKIAMKMRQKYGPAGHDRKMILNYYMSEYINSTMADFQKYVFQCVLKRSGPFGENKCKMDEKAQELLNLTQSQKLMLKTTVWQQLYPVVISNSNCCKNMYNNYVNLLNQAKKFHDKMSNGLNYVVVPQLTRLLVWFDQNRNLLQVRKLKQQWIKIFSGQFQQQEQILPQNK